MVVRTWRKLSAPGRLGHTSKHSPSNVLQQSPTDKDKATHILPLSEGIAKGELARRKTCNRKLFHSQGVQQKDRTFGESRESSPGELAINCLLLEFSTYAHWKIEQALRTVKVTSCYYLLFFSSSFSPLHVW